MEPICGIWQISVSVSVDGNSEEKKHISVSFKFTIRQFLRFFGILHPDSIPTQRRLIGNDDGLVQDFGAISKLDLFILLCWNEDKTLACRWLHTLVTRECSQQIKK